MAQSLIEGVTNYWCRTKGIHSNDLENHPQMDDVVLLIKYRDSMWHKLNKSEQAYWGAIWNWCYYRKFALKKKHLTKLELITNQATQRHLIEIIRQTKIKQKILKLRQAV